MLATIVVAVVLAAVIAVEALAFARDSSDSSRFF